MAALVSGGAASDEGIRRLLICGSPRSNGRSARLVRELAQELKAAHPQDALEEIFVSRTRVGGCVGCDRCRTAGECCQADDMPAIMESLAAADELHLVSPVYFAGPPSQLKALLDRFQPHYWAGTRYQSKRPAYLQVVGEGGDPHGFEPLVVICRSALSVAGFELREVIAHIGCDEAHDG